MLEKIEANQMEFSPHYWIKTTKPRLNTTFWVKWVCFCCSIFHNGAENELKRVEDTCPLYNKARLFKWDKLTEQSYKTLHLVLY